MNETMKVLTTRRSIRKFKSDEVPQKLLDQIVEAGMYAPTGKGSQSPIIIAVTNKQLRDEIAAENANIGGWQDGFDPFYGAPVIFLVAANADVGTAVYDGSCVIDNMLNAAWSLGLGSIWIHRAKEEIESDFGKKLLGKLGIEGNYIGVGHVAVGYIDGTSPEPKPRKDNWVYWVK